MNSKGAAVPPDVVVEKVTVENGLHDACNPHDPLAVVRLGDPTIKPVQDVKGAVVQLAHAGETDSPYRYAPMQNT